MLARAFIEQGAALAGSSASPPHATIPLHEGTRIARDGGPMPPLSGDLIVEGHGPDDSGHVGRSNFD